jgi:hypothetical protein
MKNINLNLEIDGRKESLVLKLEVDGERFMVRHDIATHDGDTKFPQFLRNELEENENSKLNNFVYTDNIFDYIEDLECAAIALMEEFCYHVKA